MVGRKRDGYAERGQGRAQLCADRPQWIGLQCAEAGSEEPTFPLCTRKTLPTVPPPRGCPPPAHSLRINGTDEACYLLGSDAKRVMRCQ